MTMPDDTAAFDRVAERLPGELKLAGLPGNQVQMIVTSPGLTATVTTTLPRLVSFADMYAMWRRTQDAYETGLCQCTHHLTEHDQNKPRRPCGRYGCDCRGFCAAKTRQVA